MKIGTAAQLRAIDYMSINDVGIPGTVLMERAGLGAFEELQKLDIKNKNVVIVCGQGNNGGDGYVICRLLQKICSVKIYLIGDSEKVKNDALINLNILKNLGISVEQIDKKYDKATRDNFELNLSNCDFLIDCIFGTGLSKNIEGIYKQIIETMNNSAAYKIAIDVPSGVNSDNGAIMGIAFKADITITFCIPKCGMYTYPGREYCGEIKVKDIGIPDEVLEKQNISINLTTNDYLSKIIKPRKNNSHKGTYGSALIVGGSRGFTGAPVLSGMGALYSGAGLITVAVPEKLHDIAENKLTEVMTYPLKDKNYKISVEAINQIKNLMNKNDCLSIGMGLGKFEDENEGLKIFEEILSYNSRCKTILIDADGLNIIAAKPQILLNKSCNVIITPHPGEMSRLINKSIEDIENNRIETARNFSKEYNVCVVLKGNCTIVAFGDEVYINTTGNAGMAQGGSGDVLSGIIASFVAQKFGVFEAAISGVYLHGLSGDIIKNSVCDYGISPTRLAKNLPFAMKQVIC